MFKAKVEMNKTYTATAELRRIRVKKGLTQQAIASLLGVTKGYYSKIENAKKRINEETHFKIVQIIDNY